ncbi:MAG: MBL fold metallo-hydrolase [Planctomycetota bacterium]
MSRRNALLAGGASAAAAFGLTPTLRAHDHAAAKAAPTQGAGFYKSSVGDIAVTLISDGWFPMDPLPVVPTDGGDDALDAALKAAHVKPGHQIGHVNAFLVESGDAKILVDAGCGTAFGADTGKLVERLGALGIDPAGLTGLLVTHIHPDHVGGLLGDYGKAFGEVPVLMLEEEPAFWGGDADLSQNLLPEEAKAGFKQNMAVATQAIAGRTEIVKATAELAPGVRVLPLPGHTPGHCGLILSSGDEKLLYVTDLLHFPAVQMAHPTWKVSFDAFPDEAVATRKSILEKAYEDEYRIAGSHLNFPGFGYVDRVAGGYRYVPEIWKW